MAGTVQQSSRLGRRPGRFATMSEINVTPFVDVMLVLLVVFMITAPLLTVGVPIDLPKASASNLQGNEEPLTVSISDRGEIFLQETLVGAEELVARLLAIAENRTSRRIFVRGDRTVDYGAVMTVMSRLNAAGFNKVALVTEAPQSQAKK
ncbi:MAG: protein TolR [Alphaproteobacteria bacterium]|jgi:biopolymer transport protein TolR|nr:protein TolR [Alphaproteobacteria bacterium]MDP6254340.1 protein TolR [Alphaproteobacteria bacterium]MDP7054936.1 protein TolR [Alphaproteobacteria bacterium]MDP7227784.1 protein TolR [Alphaproteobacteria bacterium]MDP7461979.1 protein TolR [Alphaproteobacteria bacterium]|tara:strand:+ start:13852 stop:14301 length:450 start_codon:yes stop_codon:yes gene_type:complete